MPYSRGSAGSRNARRSIASAKSSPTGLLGEYAAVGIHAEVGHTGLAKVLPSVGVTATCQSLPQRRLRNHSFDGSREGARVIDIDQHPALPPPSTQGTAPERAPPITGRR